MRLLLLLILSVFIFSCKQNPKYDTIIRNGMIYDGNGGEPFKADIAINADTIAFIGDLSKQSAKNETDAKGMAIAPGFINMLKYIGWRCSKCKNSKLPVAEFMFKINEVINSR